MITVYRATERGTTETDWLTSHHVFSFGEFFNPDRMSFRSLRVLNDDWVEPGKGFPMHGHRDMEIVSYVAAGEMSHKDSLGNGSAVRRGEVQRMSAGTGIQHGEWNSSDTDKLHLIQIWILPAEKGGEPSYEQGAFDLEAADRGWVVLAGPQGGVVTIGQDAVIACTRAATGQVRSLEFDQARYGFLYVVKGSVRFHGNQLDAGDSVAIEDESKLEVEALTPCELLAFDLA